MLTRDKHIRLREIERRALIAASVAAFVYTGGNASGAEVAEAIISALPRIEATVQKVDPPFIYRITAGGHVEKIV